MLSRVTGLSSFGKSRNRSGFRAFEKLSKIRKSFSKKNRNKKPKVKKVERRLSKNIAKVDLEKRYTAKQIGSDSAESIDNINKIITNLEGQNTQSIDNTVLSSIASDLQSAKLELEQSSDFSEIHNAQALANELSDTVASVEGLKSQEIDQTALETELQSTQSSLQTIQEDFNSLISQASVSEPEQSSDPEEEVPVITVTTSTSEATANTETSDDQKHSEVAVLSDGTSVIVYESKGLDNSSEGIAAQRIDANGNKIGSEFVVNTTTSGKQEEPTVAALTGGGYVVMWEDDGIQGQLFDNNSNKIGAEFSVSSNSASNIKNVKVASLKGGGFVATYQGKDGGDKEEIYAQQFDANGTKVGSEISVNTVEDDAQKEPTVIGLEGGGYVIAYVDDSDADGDDKGVYAQRFDSSGVKQGSEFLINQTTDDDQEEIALTAMSDGGFVAAFTSDADSDGNVYIRRFDQNGTATTGDIKVNTSASDKDMGEASIAAVSDGGYVVAYRTDKDEIAYQRYDSNNTTVGSETKINTGNNDSYSEPSVAATDDGFIVSYTTDSGSNKDDILFKKYTLSNSNVQENSYTPSTTSEATANTETSDEQRHSEAAVLSDGTSVIVYESKGIDNSSEGIAAQRIDANGNKIGSEFVVNTTTSGKQEEPTVTALTGGGYVVMWEDDGIQGQLFDNNSNKIGAEFSVSSNSASDIKNVKVASLKGGGFVATYQGKDGGNKEEIYAQQFNANGTKVGSEITVNTANKSGTQKEPTVIGLEGGGYVIAYVDDTEADGDDEGIYAQIFDSSGVKQGTEFRINENTDDDQDEISLTATSDGGFVAAFTHTDGFLFWEDSDVYIRRFDQNGTATTGDIKVNTSNADYYSGESSVATLADGGYVVAYRTDRDEIAYQRYDSNNTTVGSETIINTGNNHSYSEPSVAATDDGFIISYTTDSSSNKDDIIYRKYSIFESEQAEEEEGEESENSTVGDDEKEQISAILSDLTSINSGGNNTSLAEEIRSNLNSLLTDLNELTGVDESDLQDIKDTIQGRITAINSKLEVSEINKASQKASLLDLAEGLKKYRNLVDTPIFIAKQDPVAQPPKKIKLPPTQKERKIASTNVVTKKKISNYAIGSITNSPYAKTSALSIQVNPVPGEASITTASRVSEDVRQQELKKMIENYNQKLKEESLEALKRKRRDSTVLPYLPQSIEKQQDSTKVILPKVELGSIPKDSQKVYGKIISQRLYLRDGKIR